MLAILLKALSCVAILATAGYDAWLTARRLKKYGLAAECNPAILFLAKHIGLESALAAAIVVPTVVLTAFGLLWNPVLYFYLGVRVANFRFQLLSLAMERELDKFRAGTMPPPPG